MEVSFDPELFRILNQSGLPLDSQGPQPVKIDLHEAKKDSTKARGLQFFLEAQTFWGSPLVSNDANPSVAFRILDGSNVLLSQSTWNNSDIRTADVILLGDSAPPERIYMCELEQNQPSVRELSEGVKATGVPLTLVPVEIGMGDTWLQDQFQVGYTATPEGSQRVIFHLPRMVNDSAMVPGSPNLRNFTDSYFPSESIGVLKDFWRLKITIKDGIASNLPLEVDKTYSLYKQLTLIIKLLKAIASLIFEVDWKVIQICFLVFQIFTKCV